MCAHFSAIRNLENTDAQIKIQWAYKLYKRKKAIKKAKKDAKNAKAKPKKKTTRTTTAAATTAPPSNSVSPAKTSPTKEPNADKVKETQDGLLDI